MSDGQAAHALIAESSDEVVGSKALGKVGCCEKHQHGGHITLRRDQLCAQLIVFDHKELDRGRLRAIIRQAGLSIDESNALL